MTGFMLLLSAGYSQNSELVRNRNSLIVLGVFIIAIIVIVVIKILFDVFRNKRDKGNDLSKINFKIKMNADEKNEESAKPFDFAIIDVTAKKGINNDVIPSLFGDKTETSEGEKSKSEKVETENDKTKEDSTDCKEENLPKLDFSKRVSVSKMARSEMEKENKEKIEEVSN